ncbi:hypothetical protein QTP70_029085 [Hemibagrus guttatus]|uniref:Gypsy retrotransposon integrase-like protein 1 n=1 Tax=Hemibagrus guttatus TaxID=175788 RepID=A0AAE0Q3I5_9TELE|nr:hypothetical protein QTP70_029085 [Hemibagrus guttatus]
MSFLGYVIMWQGLEMDVTKVQAVTEWPIPSTVKELQRFLGFANFYLRFIRNYSSVVGPLTSLLKGKHWRLAWTDQAQAAFQRLKGCFTSAPSCVTRILTSPLWWKWTLRAVALGPCSPSDTARWALFFTRFQFSVTYRPGSKNGKADMLSRQFETTGEPMQPDLILPATAILAPVRWSLMEEIHRSHADEPPPAGCPATKVFVQLQFRHQVMQWVHEAPSSGHPGIRRLTQLARRRFWWPSLGTDVEEYVQACPTCAQS